MKQGASEGVGVWRFVAFRGRVKVLGFGAQRVRA